MITICSIINRCEHRRALLNVVFEHLCNQNASEGAWERNVQSDSNSTKYRFTGDRVVKCLKG